MATKLVDMRNGASKQPENTTTFNLSYTDESGNTYGGNFTVKRLTIGEIRRVGVRKAQLAEGVPVGTLDRGVAMMNAMMAHLEFAIVAAPEWWKPEAFYDADIITEVYQKVMDYEDSFRVPVRTGASGTTQAGEGGADGRESATDSVVVQEVRVAANQ